MTEKLVTATDKITLVQNSYGRCLSNGKVLETFYQKFLSSSVEVKERFKHTDFEQQHKLLRHGINLMIMYAAGNIAGQAGLRRIKDSHSRVRLNIDPRFYSLWKDALMSAIVQHDKKLDGETRRAWNEVLDKGIEFVTSGY
ncbi:globin [Fulvivirga sp. 29W222]|uniref:Globin n=1 Tax=Fulvivirga marina TaxID=2494733 RepID=A0A937G1F6_9BACT|nr:globin [Fulvivirga marina]MBL6448738.1 globin [Fulvivirga marina]